MTNSETQAQEHDTEVVLTALPSSYNKKEWISEHNEKNSNRAEHCVMPVSFPYACIYYIFLSSVSFTFSPHTDEGALVRAAKQLNFVFTGRTPDSVIIDSVSHLYVKGFLKPTLMHSRSFRDKGSKEKITVKPKFPIQGPHYPTFHLIL